MVEAVVIVSQRLSPLLLPSQPLNFSFYRNSLKVSIFYREHPARTNSIRTTPFVLIEQMFVFRYDGFSF